MTRATPNPKPPTSHVSSSPGLLSFMEVAAIIDATDTKGVPIPFVIDFVTADEGKGTGGEVIHYEKAVKYVAGGRVQFSASADKPKGNSSTQWMRRIHAVSNMEIRNVHLHLILSINGRNVR